MVPASRSAGIPNLPAAKAVDVSDMRRKLAQATSVPEARLLVDLFLAQWGFPAGKLDMTEMELAPPIILNGGSTDDGQGVGVVEMLLGEGTDEERANQEDAQGHQGQTTSVSSSSPTVSDAPLTPLSAKAAPSTRNVRVDTKPLPVPLVAPSTPPGTNLAHNSMHHRYGTNSPVMVG
jgi:hypothetical protein